MTSSLAFPDAPRSVSIFGRRDPSPPNRSWWREWRERAQIYHRIAVSPSAALTLRCQMAGQGFKSATVRDLWRRHLRHAQGRFHQPEFAGRLFCPAAKCMSEIGRIAETERKRNILVGHGSFLQIFH